MGRELLFDVPKEYAEILVETGKEGSNYKTIDDIVYGRSAAVWFTNIEHGKRHKALELMSYERNFRHSKFEDVRGIGYKRYDNYDGIDIPHVESIPSDYSKVMGVPISFLDKYCPEQFEIVGFRKGNDGKDLKVEGKDCYFRILIKAKGISDENNA